MATSADTIPSRFDVKATASDHFSWLRTRLSVERTMMSWVRTATALIGFGFTIVQFFAHIQETPGVAPAYFPHAPRYLGLSLIFCGVMALVISIWEYQGASLPLGRRLCGDRGSDPEGKANTAARGGDHSYPHRGIRFLRRAIASHIATREEETSTEQAI
jgi:uncharacterized membrane protein YidH (DUF202 family)